MSGDDLKFISIMQEGIKVADDGHIQLPLPLKDDSPMPVNRSQADVLLSKLKHKLEIDEVYRGIISPSCLSYLMPDTLKR